MDQRSNRGGVTWGCVFFLVKFWKSLSSFFTFFYLVLKGVKKNWPPKTLFLDNLRGVSRKSFGSKAFFKIDFIAALWIDFSQKLPKFSYTEPSSPFSGASCQESVSFFGYIGTKSVSFFQLGHPLLRPVTSPYSILDLDQTQK